MSTIKRKDAKLYKDWHQKSYDSLIKYNIFYFKDRYNKSHKHLFWYQLTHRMALFKNKKSNY